ncbi:SMP-30/gluconolactonase/LRE family protein [Demequina capsici]|uniref:SMP-30/gluconolactonase/LRE family protein n=1 Tax=Demequina capsici TaxID=3075620 RepID=A0AA96FEY1_9MICO|nr:SMP-30/gluconolactonase/LRE family protein [Demequina sp. PMTSA13]WNM28442.1 SMP-30/gluconolactonase/LRE family protein [Demequina sp. PMTSA13]
MAVPGSECSLGESPSWDADAGVLRWVDLTGGRLLEAPVAVAGVGEPREVLRVQGIVAAVTHGDDGGLLLVGERHLIHVDSSGATVGRVEMVSDRTGRRLNDGACDPAGRFVVGTVGPTWDRADESLWRLEADGTVAEIASGITASNGIGWSPDGTQMYHADTFSHVVTTRAYGTDHVGEPSVVVDCGGDLPDGLAVDSDGALWVAFWGAGQVRRYTPDGTLLQVVRTGAPLTTSCAFAGPELDILVITTAVGLETDDREPTIGPAGRLLWCRPGVHGIPAAPWQRLPLSSGS